MLQIFGAAPTVAKLEELIPAALAKAGEAVALLRSGTADRARACHPPPPEPGSRRVHDKHRKRRRGKSLDEAGVHLAPGEMVEYIIVDASGKKKPAKALPVPLYESSEGYDIERTPTWRSKL